MPSRLRVASSAAVQRPRSINSVQIGGQGSRAAASVRLLVPGPFQDDNRLAIAQIRLIHENGLAELMLQHLAHNVEVGGGLPAGLQLTAAGHAMALAAELHVVGDGLNRG